MSITTVSSREFNQDVSKAKRAASKGPVFITDRGRAAHVLLTIAEYEKLAKQYAKRKLDGEDSDSDDDEKKEGCVIQ